MARKKPKGKGVAYTMFNVNYDPGWKTATPGVPAPVRVRGRLTVRLPAGTTHAALQFRPDAFVWGAALTATTLLVGLGMLVAAARTGRRRAGTTATGRNDSERAAQPGDALP